MGFFKTYTLLRLLVALAGPVSLFAQEVIKPGAAGGHAAIAAANIQMAMDFLRAWGFVPEADNIKKWFTDGKIFLDWDVTQAETGTASANISLNGLILLGSVKSNPGLFHKFDPADVQDKERIAKLAFTLVHEKVHAHQSFISFSYGREGNEADAYNKEIVDAETTLNKMEQELNKAINAGDVEKQKQLRQWISAVLDVKIDAITTFGDNYPESRRISWPDKVLDDLRGLRDKNEKELGKLKTAVVDPGKTNTEFGTLLAQLNEYERLLPARPMPGYWMEVNNIPATTYVELKTTPWLRTVLFTLPDGQVSVSLPADMKGNENITGSVKMIPNLNTQPVNNQSITVETGGQTVNPGAGNFTLTYPGRLAKNGIVVSLLNNGERKANILVPFDTANYATGNQNVITIPVVGLQGAPLVINGPFDGDLSNTRCNIAGVPAKVLSESPRRLIIHPGETIGLMKITLREGNIEKQEDYRAVGLEMDISKTNLRKGERATISLIADGLQGLNQPIYLRLETKGQVAMKKGNFQIIEIRPSEVQPNGTWTQKRTITGIQTGDFEVTASISNQKQ